MRNERLDDFFVGESAFCNYMKVFHYIGFRDFAFGVTQLFDLPLDSLLLGIELFYLVFNVLVGHAVFNGLNKIIALLDDRLEVGLRSLDRRLRFPVGSESRESLG
ncbi:MAG: hypothetical protein IJ087_01190 [Eggerthellaceae bacterium]|nr:hypothetical protein [Eggerthellaceae bacterium]